LASGKEKDPTPDDQTIIPSHASDFANLPDEILFDLMKQTSGKDLRYGLERTCKYLYLKFLTKLPELEFVYDSKTLNPQYINLALDQGHVPRTIRMIGCTWTDIGGATMGATIKKLPSLALDGVKSLFSPASKNPSPVVEQRPSTLTTLQTLEIKGIYPTDWSHTNHHKYKISRIFLDRFKQFTNVKSAMIFCIFFDEPELKMLSSALQQMVGLTSLSLIRTQIGGSLTFFDEINLPSLTKLNVHSNDLGNPHFKGISRYTNLTWLDVGSNTEIGKNPANQQLLSSLTKLRFLSLKRVGINNDFAFIQNFTALEALDIRENLIDGKGSDLIVRLTPAFTSLTHLKDLAILSKLVPIDEESISALKNAFPSLQEVSSVNSNLFPENPES
jgi:hypothetical protein